MSKRISVMLEEVIELHWFAGFSPVQFLTKACRLGEAVEPPIKVWSSVALAIILPDSSMMTFMRAASSATPPRRSRDAA
jgi:hypothetical protein